MRIVTAALVLVLGVGLLAAAAGAEVLPRPVKTTARAGAFTITGRTAIWTDAASAALGRQLARYLEPATGFTFRVLAGGTAPPGRSSSGAIPH